MPNLAQVREQKALRSHTFKFFDYVMAASCVVVVCANIIGAGKVANISGFAFGAGVLFFPLSYVLSDIVTEVYGYARARRVIWVSFGSAIFAAVMAAFITAMPADAEWNAAIGGVDRQTIFEMSFGQAPRIIAASLFAIWCGEFVNAYVMSKMKLASEGKALYKRTIGSTIAGQGVDTLIFYPLAFLGVWSIELIVTVMLTNYFLKVAWEICLTPVTYKVVAALKKREGVDVFDDGTNYSPLTTKL